MNIPKNILKNISHIKKKSIVSKKKAHLSCGTISPFLLLIESQSTQESKADSSQHGNT